MTADNKDIIYIDIDDEITSIIEKVQTADKRIVALVLPKRATVLQSVVNMKLLKRSADEASKNIVLISSEAGLMPLAGAVGVHVAKTLQTKPMIPTAPKIYDGNAVADDDEPVESGDDEPLDANKPIGLLAGLRGSLGRKDEEETIEVDNSDEATETEAELAKPVKKPNKKLKVPNFNKFRTRLILGGAGLIVILFLWYIAAFVMPKAKIVVKTITSSETAQVAFTTDPALTELNAEASILPSAFEQVKKTDTEKATATGEKDNGTKATGTITIRNCDYSDGFTISAGSTFSGGGKSFITTKAVTVPEFDGPASGCDLDDDDEAGQASVTVQAQAAGESYNVAARSYTVPGIPSSADVDAVGSAMTGGTTQIVKVLSQADFDAAAKKIEERLQAEDEIKEELMTTLRDKGYFPLEESLIVGTPEVTSAPKVGEEASEATITSNITYTMIGVKEDDIKTLLRNSLADEIDDNKEMIQSTGLDEAQIRITDKTPDGKSTGSVQSIVVIGPKLNIDNLKKSIAGKKKSETVDILKSNPGVDEVIIDYSPFWVFSTPGKTGKISITLEQANPTDDE